MFMGQAENILNLIETTLKELDQEESKENMFAIVNVISNDMTEQELETMFAVYDLEEVLKVA